MLRKVLALCVGVMVTVAATWAVLTWAWPRPVDTTDPEVFAGDGAAVDYCDLPVLDGNGLTAADIPKSFTPGCGWETWPMPVLADCREPLASDAADLRGLWQSTTPGIEHVERIEQCGNRAIVTARGIIHDFRTDGTLGNGARDVQRPSCMNIYAAIEWRDGVMTFRPFGLPYTIVTRHLEGDELVWNYPTLGEVRMKRICQVPAKVPANGSGTSTSNQHAEA